MVHIVQEIRPPMKQIKVDLNGFKTYVDFEIIESWDEKNLYPTLLGIEWAFDNDHYPKFELVKNVI